MNEAQVVQAVYDTLDDNKASFVSGLMQNGIERELLSLSDTTMQMPSAYYAAWIACTEAREQNAPETMNSDQASPYLTEYDIVIFLADYATFDEDDVDTNSYGSTAHDNFRTFCDRIVKRFRRDQKWFPSVTASPRFRVRVDSRLGRSVEKVNEMPDPVGDGTYILAASIVFALIGCDD